jgi:PAS domain S-box-containing protein
VGIGVVVDRHFQFVNQPLCDMLGYPAEAFIGKNARFIYPSDAEYNAVGSEKYRQIQLTGKGTVETRCRRRDGSVIDVLMSSCPIDVDDWSKGVTFSVLDITARKNMEKALRLSEEKYRELVENINETIFVTDLEGIITFISPKIEPILGYSPAEIIGKSFIHFVYPQDLERIKERFQNLISGGGGSNEYRFVDRTGKIIWIRTSSRPAYKNKQISGSMGTIVDITEQKALAAELQQSRKMEAVGTLAGGIAHDFNNILSAIIGYAELSLLAVPGEHEIKQYLNEVLRAGTRARDLVRQILTFSRQQENELCDLQIKPIVKETLKFLRSTLPATIEIRQYLIEKEFCSVRANPTQIQQVIMNLCTNAVQSMENQGGILDVRLEQTEIESSFPRHHLDLDPGLYMKLTVKDTGHGISTQVMSSIFDPYFTTKKPGKGTGLGLSVVYGIVKNLGGEIAVESETGMGTRFDVYFPAEKDKKPSMSSRIHEFPRGKERILVVDDEPGVVMTSKLRLERIGYTVEVKTDSEEALEMIRAVPDKFDLVITDMTMPKMTGDVLAGEIMKLRPDLPVILCTGYSAEITEELSEKKGIKALLMKPIMMDELAKTIRRVLDNG